jgi:hypothetical protein
MTSLYTLIFPSLLHSLKQSVIQLQKGLDHATASAVDPSTLLNARLHADMADLAHQIFWSTAVARMIPSSLNPSITPFDAPANDTFDTAYPDLITRVQKTVQYLEAIKPEDINGNEEREIGMRVPLTGPVEYKFTGLTFFQHMAQPNIWFHLVTTYDILRKEGVVLGEFILFFRFSLCYVLFSSLVFLLIITWLTGC